MEKKILSLIKEKKHIIIVGETNIGKSYFIKNTLISFLEKQGLKINYFDECYNIILNLKADINIIDEVELLFDKEFLENLHPEDNPFYSKSYLERVHNWHEKIKNIKTPLILIVTRNNPIEVKNLINNYKNLEWNDESVEIIEFKKIF